MRFLSAPEVHRLASEVEPRYEALVLTLAYSGIRIGEASALRVRNFEALKARLSIVEAASEVDGVRLVGETKNRKRRTVAIPRSLAEVLGDHIAVFSGPLGADADRLIFTTGDGHPVGQHASGEPCRGQRAGPGLIHFRECMTFGIPPWRWRSSKAPIRS